MSTTSISTFCLSVFLSFFSLFSFLFSLFSFLFSLFSFLFSLFSFLFYVFFFFCFFAFLLFLFLFLFSLFLFLFFHFPSFLLPSSRHLFLRVFRVLPWLFLCLFFLFPFPSSPHGTTYLRRLLLLRLSEATEILLVLSSPSLVELNSSLRCLHLLCSLEA